MKGRRVPPKPNSPERPAEMTKSQVITGTTTDESGRIKTYTVNGRLTGIQIDGVLFSPLSRLAEHLAAARTVVEAARAAQDAPLFEHRAPLEAALAAYEAARKGTTDGL